MATRKSQAWSMDLIIAMVIFVLIIAIFYSLLSVPQNVAPRELQQDAKEISAKLETSNTACDIMSGGDIDRNQLAECYKSDPEEFRKLLGIGSKFCVYVQDQSGRIIEISNLGNPLNPEPRLGFGYDDLILGHTNPTACGEIVAPP